MNFLSFKYDQVIGEAYIEDNPPIFIEYSGGNHYSALNVPEDDSAEEIAATICEQIENEESMKDEERDEPLGGEED